GAVELLAAGLRPHPRVERRRAVAGALVDALGHVRVVWDLLRGQGDALRAGGLPQHVVARARALAGPDRHAAAQGREGEGGDAVAGEGRAEQLKQRLVPGDREELSLAEGPANRGEGESDQGDVTKVRRVHRNPPAGMVRARVSVKSRMGGRGLAEY